MRRATISARARRKVRTVVTLLIAVLFLQATAAPTQAASDPVAALIARARAALGPGLGKVKLLHLTGMFSAGGISGITETWIQTSDGRFVTTVYDGPLTASSGYDGHTAWHGDSKGIVLPQTGPLAAKFNADEIYNNSYGLFSPEYGGATVSYLGNKLDQEKSYEAISVKPRGGLAEEVWFDPSTGLPARTVSDHGPGTISTTLLDYRSVGGLMYPCEQTATSRIKDRYGHAQNYAAYKTVYKYNLAEARLDDATSRFAMPRMAVGDVSLAGGETRIPFTMQNYWIYIDVRLNGKGPFHFMLDSGGRNILSSSIAWQVGAQPTGEIPLSSARPVRFARVASVQIGGATLSQQDFNVGRIGNVFARDGMIGFELFERFLTTIDYANRQIILRSPDMTGSKPAAPAGGASLPLMFDDTKPETACKVVGTAATCIADTGAAFALILSGPMVKANADIKPPWYAGAYGQVSGPGGLSEVRRGPLDSLQLGPFGLSGIDTFFTTRGTGALAEYLSALVGNRVWEKFTVTYDYAHATLHLTPNAKYNH